MELFWESDIEGKTVREAASELGSERVSNERERISQSVLWRTVIERRAFGAKHTHLHGVSRLSVGVQTDGTCKGRLSLREGEGEGEGAPSALCRLEGSNPSPPAFAVLRRGR
jgi:hypothetical protein